MPRKAAKSAKRTLGQPWQRATPNQILDDRFEPDLDASQDAAARGLEPDAKKNRC